MAIAELLERAGEASEFLKKLANPNRLMIVCALVDGERSVRHLEDSLGIRQPGLSQQIAELRDAGLITGRKQSKSVFYRLADERVAEIVSLLYRMFCEPGAGSISTEGNKND
ncbi:metalloregulator ArsR/SmtB family transcription factor [Aminobacter sp. AP02]|uniref:ArsR/SmtB family transcription factor n=1 Tax=Aminobacter sp. AP02 TaxID=2135737 RepID=UPI000D6B4977|nr:metalloregulator ArsR/SmtB family transcription factor [Aminobacter sp. AP02]